MFARFGELGARGELTPETMAATAARYGSTMSMEWVPGPDGPLWPRTHALTAIGSLAPGSS